MWWLLLLACADPKADPGDTGVEAEPPPGSTLVEPTTPTTSTTPTPPTTPTGDTAASIVTVASSETVPQVMWVDWNGGASTVRWRLDGGDLGAVDGEPPVALIGLKAETTYTIEVDGVGTAEWSTALPSSLPPPRLVHTDPRSEVADGHLLTTTFSAAGRASFVVIVDGDGDVVWAVPDDGPQTKITRARLGRDRDSVLWSAYAWERDVDTGRIERLSLDGTRYTLTPAVEQHHDFWEHADGTLAWLAWDVRDTDLTPGLAAPSIYRGPEGGGGAEQLFSLHDDYPHAPWWVCGHMIPGAFRPGVTEWAHSNSLVYDESADRYWVMSRYMDALWTVDATSGALGWQLGGRYDEFTAEPGLMPFDHAHFTQRWDDRVLVFDNRGNSPGPSRAVEYAIDEGARTWREVWSVDHPDGRVAGFQGDARRLPGGNTVVSWAPHGLITEHTPDGEVVWRLEWDQTLTRLSYLPELPPR
ncbi:MAG: hypothetical protein ACI8PZ_001807 [Myxococcota bacterium]|jgi:hypothetical protein